MRSYATDSWVCTHSSFIVWGYIWIGCVLIGRPCSLEQLILSANEIESIDPIPGSTSGLSGTISPVRNLKYLAVTFNHLKSWSDVDRIPTWCPNLEALKVTGNPFTEGRSAAAIRSRSYVS